MQIVQTDKGSKGSKGSLKARDEIHCALRKNTYPTPSPFPLWNELSGLWERKTSTENETLRNATNYGKSPWHYPAWHERQHFPLWPSASACADRKCSCSLSSRPNDLLHCGKEHLNASGNTCLSLMCRHNDVSRENRRGFVQSFQPHLRGPVLLFLWKVD